MANKRPNKVYAYAVILFLVCFVFLFTTLTGYMAGYIEYVSLSSDFPDINFQEVNRELMAFSKDNVAVELQGPRIAENRIIRVVQDTVYVKGIDFDSATVYVEHGPLGAVYTIPSIYYCADADFDPDTMQCADWQVLTEKKVIEVCEGQTIGEEGLTEEVIEGVSIPETEEAEQITQTEVQETEGLEEVEGMQGPELTGELIGMEWQEESGAEAMTEFEVSSEERAGCKNITIDVPVRPQFNESHYWFSVAHFTAYYVNSSGGDFPNITACLDAINETGDSCYINEPGEYVIENETYYSISDPDGDGVINLVADDIILDCNNSIIERKLFYRNDTGILAKDRNNIKIQNCIVRNYDYDVNVTGSASCSLMSNNIKNAYFTNSELCNLSSNTFWNAFITNSQGFTLTSNNISDNLRISGDDIIYYNHAIDLSNLLNGGLIYYNLSVSDYIYSGLTANWLVCVNCSNISIVDSNISHQGIFLGWTNTSLIANSTGTFWGSSETGITLFRSRDAEISNYRSGNISAIGSSSPNLSFFRYGILLNESINVSIKDDTQLAYAYLNYTPGNIISYILYLVNSNNTIINNVTAKGWQLEGSFENTSILKLVNSHNNSINSSYFYYSASSTIIINMTNSSDNNISNSNIITAGSGAWAKGIALSMSNSHRNVFTNNIILGKNSHTGNQLSPLPGCAQIAYSQNNTFINNSMEGTYGAYWAAGAIYVTNSPNTIFINNTINSSYSSAVAWDLPTIRFSSSPGCVMEGNNLSRTSSIGVMIENSGNLTLLGNNINRSVVGGLVIRGSSLSHYLHTISSDNLVGGKPVYYNHSISDHIFSGLDADMIACANCSNIIIEDSNVSRDGIRLWWTNHSLINNSFSNDTWEGMVLYKSRNITMMNNQINKSRYRGLSITGDTIEEVCHTIDTSNLEDGVPIQYACGQSDLVYENLVIPYLACANCTNLIIRNCTFANGTGLNIWFSDNASIYNNTFDNFKMISLKNHTCNVFENNTIKSQSITAPGANFITQNKLVFSNISSCKIYNNTIYSSASEFIGTNSLVLEKSSGNLIDSNRLIGLRCHGILLSSSPNNTISNNIANTTIPIGGSCYGFYLSSQSNNLVVYNNTAIGATTTNAAGFGCGSSNNLNISFNNATKNYYGFSINGCQNSNITDNVANNNTATGFVIFTVSTDTKIANNNASSNSYGFSFSSPGLIIENNTADNNTYGFTVAAANNLTNNTAVGGTLGFNISFTAPNSNLTNNTALKSTYGFYISAQNTTLVGNIGENNSYGFYLSESSSGSVLKGNTAKNSTSQGFSLYYTKNVTLEDNIAIGIPRGIYTFNTTDAKIHNSNITGCDWSIVLGNSSNITMTDNIVTDSKYYGIFVNGNAPYHFAHTIPTSNTINGKPVYYNHSLSNYAFDGLDAGHIECAFCNGVNITNSQAIGDGIILRFSNNSRIEQCDVSTTYSSLWGYKLENTSINNSVFNYNSNIEYSNNTFISNSTFQNSSTDLRIFRVNNTFISNSTFQNASRGLSVSSSNNTFISNSTFQNASTGLYVSSANNTFISNSTFQNASTGLYVSSANNISIDTSRFLDSDNCIFASPKTGFLTNSNFSNCITSTITGSWQDSNISGNKIENCGESVVSLTVNNSIISYNNISNCSSTVIIIHLDGSGIEFSNNIFENSSTMDYFVDLAVSPTTTLTNNVRKNLFRNITALVILYIENSQNISVEDNEFINNTASSILTLWAVTNSTFSGNYFNNSPDSVDYSIVIGDTDTTNNVFHHNYFYNSSILHAFAEEPGNHFNITGSGAQGNYWDDIGNLQIYDIDGDGYGDSGPDYPYSNATGGRVSPNVVDWGPILEEDVTPPQITIISPENITYCSSSLWANISCNEPCNWAGYSLDGQPNVSMSSTDYWNWSAYLTGLSNGQHNITFWANDTSGNMNQSDYVWFSIDISGPYWSGNITAPASPTTYQPGKNYQFNITWTDPNSIDTALIRGNFTGTMQNYTPTKVGDVYSITIADLAAGTYAWGSWANDSICGNSNSTPDWIYLVNKAETILTLSAQPAWSVTYGTQTNITCSANNNEAQIALYRNDSQVASGYGLVYESTTLAAGLWNYTCNTSGSQNWTAASVSNLLNVTLADTNPPGIIFITPTPTNASYRNINWVYINISVTDDTSNIDACWVEWNGSNYTMTKVGSGLSVTCWYNMTDLADGIYSYKAWANDSVGNVGLSEERIVTIDTEPPKILNVRAESITTSSAVIKWDTDEEANATVRYGKTQALGSVRSNSSFALNHTIDLVNLESGTLYYYNVSSCDRAGNCNMTGLYNFTTNIYIPPRPPAGGAGPSISYLHIIVNVTPQEVVISPNIIVLFEVVDFDSLTRSLRWTGTDKGKVTFTIQGMAIELPLNKRVDIDLNGDNENDIWITVTRIDATVTFLIAKIPKEIPAPPEIICQPGERRCEGRELQECGREGTEWRTLVICEYACVNLTCLVPPVIPIGPTAAPPVEITSLAIAIASIAILSGIFYAKRRLRKGLADVMKDVYGMIKQGKTDYQIRNALQTAGLGTRTIELILQEMRSRPNKIDAMMGWVQEQIKAGKSKKEIKKQLMREGWPKEMAEMAIRD